MFKHCSRSSLFKYKVNRKHQKDEAYYVIHLQLHTKSKIGESNKHHQCYHFLHHLKLHQ